MGATSKQDNATGDYKTAIDSKVAGYTAQVDKTYEKVKSGDYKALKRKVDQSGADLGQLDLHIDTVLKAAKKEVKNLQRAENEIQGVAQKDKLIAKLTNAADEAIREIEDRESAIEEHSQEQ